MPWTWGVPSILFLALAGPSAAQDADASRMSARELFYNAVQKPKASSQAKPANRPVRPSVAASTSTPPARSAEAVSAPVVPATAKTEPPLGLKYWIERRVDGHMVETPSDAGFRAGDAIQLGVETNAPGYLYIVNQGSSGAWKPLFPAPEIAHGDNRVEAHHKYILPPEHLMVFDEHTGTEKVTILFSRQPIADFEELIYSLQERPKPAAQPEQRQAPKAMVAEARLSIDDATVGRLREASSRDLIIERVDSPPPPQAGAAAGEKETAVYVVNPEGSANSRLAADLHLVHR